MLHLVMPRDEGTIAVESESAHVIEVRDSTRLLLVQLPDTLHLEQAANSFRLLQEQCERAGVDLTRLCLVVGPDVSLHALDEDMMASLGWVRAESVSQFGQVQA